MLERAQELARSSDRGAFRRAIGRSLRGTGDGAAPSLEAHMHATYDWLCAAQDAGDDDGVASFYDLVAGRWSPSYPETTGYIIPTLLAYADACDAPEARARALRMADWEAAVQMADGAVLSGPIGTPRGPAVFNTGQGLFGWVAAFAETDDVRYGEAARRAARWLVDNQDDDGAWRRSLSMMTTASVCTYNVRCGWALAYAGTVLGEEGFLAAARRAGDWAFTQQNNAGWFAHTGFADGDVPLLHTISYVIEGLLGIDAYAPDERTAEGARRAADRLAGLYRRDGRLGGRLDEDWSATVSWRCVTGDAQVAVVLHRLARTTGDEGYAAVARSLLEDVARTQLTGPGPGARGALTGSFPVWGDYLSFAAPNWAAKFFLDGLLLEVAGVDERSFPARGGA